MAEAVTLDVVIAWFREYQKNCIIKDGVVPEWFHGIISRKQSEEMLMSKPPGCFLIRVSESRIGYTLSYRAQDCCRHFMIDMLPDNQYVIVGEKMRHRSLDDLVAFHSQNSICPFTELLTVACDPVSKDQVDGADLLFSQGIGCHPEMWLNTSQTQPNAPEDTLQARSTIQHSLSYPSDQPLYLRPSFTTDVIASHPRLYPSLKEELGVMNLHNSDTPLPLPRGRSKSMDTSAQLPSRHNKPSTGRERWLPKQPSEQKSPTESKVFSLAQCRKIFQKKKNPSEEHILKTNSGATNKNTSGLINSLKVGLSKTTANTLPTEYHHNPPPFAPGY